MNYRLNIKSKAESKKDILKSIMKERNMSKEEIIEFMNTSVKQHSPFLFSNMNVVVDKINRAVENHDLVLIVGDYDCDRRLKYLCCI